MVEHQEAGHRSSMADEEVLQSQIGGQVVADPVHPAANLTPRSIYAEPWGEAAAADVPLEAFPNMVGVTRQTLYHWRDEAGSH